jgi:ribosomal protein uL22
MQMAAGYGYQAKKGAAARIAKARVTGVNASYKDLAEVCRSVRRKPTGDAIEFLQLAAEKKRAIRFARHNPGKGHRKELGGKAGGWPVKSAKIVLTVLQNALANANRLGLGTTRVVHILANKQYSYPRLSPKGRRVRHDYETALVEVVLEEIQAASPPVSSTASQLRMQQKAEAKKEKKDAAKKPEQQKKTESRSPEAPKTADVPKAEVKKEAQPMAQMAGAPQKQ